MHMYFGHDFSGHEFDIYNFCINYYNVLFVVIKSQERDEHVRRALKALQDNPRLSRAQATKRNGISTSALSNHRKRRISRTTTRHMNAKLTYHQEAVLAYSELSGTV